MDHSNHRRSDSSDDGTYSTRRNVIREDLARRLRRICAHLSDEDFRELVEMMTERQLRSERRSNL